MGAVTLESLGVSPAIRELAAPFDPSRFRLARAIRVERGFATVIHDDGELSVHVPKGLLRTTEQTPVTGDWLMLDVDKQAVARVLERRTAVVRGAAGRREEPQVVAANVDWVFVLTGLDGDFNLRRLERYLAIVGDSGALPVVFLTKAGLIPDVSVPLALAREVAPGVAVHAIDVISGIGTDAPSQYLRPGVSAALLGSSGVGKSTFANFLLGADVVKTQEVRARDDRGKHTTTRRELFLLPRGGVVIDTPGMRELSLWGDADALDAAFPDIAELSLGCRFSDCGHQKEPGCAVLKAKESGALEAARLDSYLALLREVTGLASSRRPPRASERPSKRPPRGR